MRWAEGRSRGRSLRPVWSPAGLLQKQPGSYGDEVQPRAPGGPSTLLLRAAEGRAGGPMAGADGDKGDRAQTTKPPAAVV